MKREREREIEWEIKDRAAEELEPKPVDSPKITVVCLCPAIFLDPGLM